MTLPAVVAIDACWQHTGAQKAPPLFKLARHGGSPEAGPESAAPPVSREEEGEPWGHAGQLLI
jgi:hypothetical protein